MQNRTLVLVLLVCAAVQVFGEPVVVSQSFTGNDFADADGWVTAGGPAHVTECSGTKMFGGFNKFGAKAVASKVFELPPHSLINLKLQFWKIDSWDNEEGYIFVDDQLVWSRKFQYNEGDGQKCGQGGDWKEMLVNLNLNIKHTGPTAVVVITSNLNEAADNESWAFRDFVIAVEKCPNGCSACQVDEKAESCSFWQSFSSSWGALDANQLGADGWDVAGGASSATQCGAAALFGGFDKTGARAVVSKVLKVKPHYKLKIKVLWAKIDSWDNEAAQIKVDGKLVWERRFQWHEGYFGKICGCPVFEWKSMFARTEVDIDHTGEQAKIEFTSTLDEAPNNESFGLRDLYIYLAACSDNCAECTGPKDTDCKKCSNNWALVGGKCQALPNFILLEQSFLEDKFTGVNGWVLTGNKAGRTVAECNGKSMVGGFDIMGAGGKATKTFEIPPHKRLRLQTTIYKIDSWDGEFMMIKVDGTDVWKTSWNLQTGGANICGQGVWWDGFTGVDEIFNHQSPKAEIIFTSTLDQDAADESWGFRDFKLWYEPKEACAVFYSECDFKGASFEFCSKSPNFQNDNIPPQIRSIKVPPQGRVTLYESTDYNGKKVTYSSDQACIQSFDFALIQMSGHVEGGWVEVEQ
ncbi:unnamed protein product (macronuclear) [Paramecium tetraurelia]|uniref:Beta/gamma crystallin 'Greek key' domain-containing protein n=1 Tax=Paramecium tetraurelia TaxID=5888 RepID=A0C1L6_PARTE|nr:uncharacterized protein GSPATT00034160001 [Paramecium tetraurelia]CAK64683.1 unnamed protein product [Paramecium tetraurelia]|eukprot:XP_001432080.1 hypothetical protein (macronuclear) [Paramecium tetraurelia strain d4-2]